jgi:hypothetical protein
VLPVPEEPVDEPVDELVEPIALPVVPLLAPVVPEAPVVAPWVDVTPVDAAALELLATPLVEPDGPAVAVWLELAPVLEAVTVAPELELDVVAPLEQPAIRMPNTQIERCKRAIVMPPR